MSWLETMHWMQLSSTFRLRRFMLAATLTVVSAITLGCSTQQLYGTGQAWQRNECQRLVDQYERERCLTNANTSYESYQKQMSIKN